MLLLFATALMHASEPAPDDTAQILQLERQMMAAIKNKDTAAIERLLAPDFIYRTPGAQDAGRADFLRIAQSIPVKIVDVWGDDLKVTLYGDVAVLTGIQKARTLDDKGQELLSAGAFVDVFRRRDGRWLMVLAHTVELPEVPRSVTPPQR